MQPKHKSYAVKIFIAVGIDIVLFLLFILWWQPVHDESTIELLLLMAIFVINIGLAIASKYTMSSWYLPLALNSIIAILIFHIVLSGWYGYHDRGLRKMRFVTGGKTYELIFDKKDTSYNFYEKYSNESSNRLMSGQYKIKGDSMYLTDLVNQMIVCKDSLIGFAEEKIALKAE